MLSLPGPRPAGARPRAPAPAQRLLWWLVLALLLAPALGRIHQVLHPPAWQGAALGHSHSYAHGHGHAKLPSGAAVDAGASDSAGWLLALFIGHSHSDCQLHDQLNAWASPPVLAQALAAALLEEPARHVPGRVAFAGSAAFFDPRAPPAAA